MSAVPVRNTMFTTEQVSEVAKPKKGIPCSKPTPHEKIAALLNEIANTGTIWDACETVGIGVTTWEHLRRTEPELQKLHESALDLYRARLRRTIHQRAVEGILKPVYYKGQPVGEVREFSDRLLEFQAKRHMPEYREKSEVDHNISGGVLVMPATIQNAQEWHNEMSQIERQTDEETS